ncbi:MAG: transglutaminaseTgpA domain-containing protein [Microbacteriaceae bacterium]
MVLADSRTRPTSTASAPSASTPPRRAPRRDDLPPGEPRPIFVTLLLAPALGLAMSSLHVLLSGAQWWFSSFAMILLVLGVAAATRALVRNRVLPTVAGLIAALVALTVVFAPGTAWFGVIPNADTVDAWVRIAQQGAASVGAQRIPATADDGILFLIVILSAFVAFWADATAIALRQRAIAAAPLALPLVVPLTISSGIASVPVYVAVVILWLMMLRLGRPRMPLSATLGAGAIVVAASLLLPFALPATVAPSSGGGGGQTRINPLIDLGDDLRRAAAVRALTYQSEEGLYLRLATLEEFTGRAWSPVEVARRGGNLIDGDGTEFAAAAGLSDAVERLQLETSIEIGQIGGRWLPVPYPATTIEGLDGDWFWEPSGLSVRSSGAGVDSQEYDVRFLGLEPTREQLAASGTPTAAGYSIDFDRFTALPEIPQVIGDTAAEVTAEADNNYDRALALQDFFRNGDFVYSEDTPVEEGYDGTGAEVIERFLEVRAGYCVHFASAMAVMARTLDIPARVVVGFQPGTRANQGGETVYQVSTHDLHAWPELFFEGVGWTRFEPTVSRGEVPEYATPVFDDPDTAPIEGPTEPPIEPTTAPSTAPSDRPGEDDTAAGGPDEPAVVIEESTVVTLGISALALLLLASPAILRAGIRSWRFRAARRGPLAGPLWTELRETARDYGWVAAETETPHDLADRLRAIMPESEDDPLTRLLHAVETEAYARRTGVDHDEAAWTATADLRRVRSEIIAAATRREQLRGALLPPSLTSRVISPAFESESR